MHTFQSLWKPPQAAVAVWLSACIQKTRMMKTLRRTVITKPWLINPGCVQVVSSNVSGGYSKWARAARRHSRSSVKHFGAGAPQTLVGTNENKTEQSPCCHQRDGAFHALESLRREKELSGQGNNRVRHQHPELPLMFSRLWFTGASG